MTIELIAMQLFSGLALGAILIMVALGLSIGHLDFSLFSAAQGQFGGVKPV